MKPATLVTAAVLALTIALPAASAQVTLEPQLVEVQPDADEPGPDGEWVEFANPSALPADLDGLYLTDHDACFAPGEGFVEEYRWPLNATVPAHDVIALELPDACLTLADGGDDLTLETRDGRALEHVAYGDAGDLPAPEDGQSLAACHEGGHQYEGWDTRPTTPDRANPSCEPPAPSPITPWQ